MPYEKTLIFSLETKKTLNSNRMPNKMIVKSQLASKLRKIGQEKGITEHQNSSLAQQRLNSIIQEEERRMQKSRHRKRLKKNNIDEKIIEKEIAILHKDYSPEIDSKDIPVPYMFNNFTVDIVVRSPTKRIIDPVNFYPTIKPIIDGLTDASWWEDDNFNKLQKISFEYGGLSEVKDHYQFILHIKEI